MLYIASNMNHFILPKIINNLTINDIDVKYTNNIENIWISESLNYYLSNIKQEINKHLNEWDMYKKYTNPYEYIHSLIPEKKFSISKLKPLSRSFYKMVEICNNFEIIPANDNPIKSFHLAEGPGGFIEALIFLHDNPKNIYYGITLQSTNYDIPGWKKSQEFLKRNPNVIIDNGPEKNGDLFEANNLKYCYEKYKNSMDIITGDGGFDFSIDFNNQEKNSIKLIFAQICFALSMQKQGGKFILKIFDIFTKSTIDLLYLLNNLYETVYIIKPNTSRMANSEKYLVCINYYNKNNLLIEYFIDNFESIISSELYINGFLNVDIPYIFNNKLEEYKAIFGQQQIENINNTINKIINKDNFNEELIKSNIQKCVMWCTKYDIPFNTIS